MTVFDIPRLDGETSRAYAARLAYPTLGPGRSLAQVCDAKRGQTGGKAGVTNRLSTLEGWSTQHEWVKHARAYDDLLAGMALQEAAQRYMTDLELHRQRAMQYGEILCAVAIEMLAEARNQRKTMDYSPAALNTIARALTTGMDLQAHALRVAELLPKLTTDEPDHE